jgi:hypothetical protein
MWQAVLDMMNRKDHLKEEGIEVNLKIRELQHQSLGPNGHRCSATFISKQHSPRGKRGMYYPKM